MSRSKIRSGLPGKCGSTRCGIYSPHKYGSSTSQHALKPSERRAIQGDTVAENEGYGDCDSFCKRCDDGPWSVPSTGLEPWDAPREVAARPEQPKYYVLSRWLAGDK